MIADKSIPAFYLMHLEGKITDIEFMLGEKLSIKSITISSHEFPSDVEAINAGEEAIKFFSRNKKINLQSCEKAQKFNPEFYPNVEHEEPSREILEKEAIAEMAVEEQMAQDPTKIVLALTYRFDALGDFVVSKTDYVGKNYKISIKTAINPTRFMHEKSLEFQKQQQLLYNYEAREYSKISYH